jgi:hypothetical protein
LKHTRKHERRRKESIQRAKHLGSGGPSGQEGRTVRTGHADRPACCRGLSALRPRTVRPCAADHPKKQTEPPETTPNNGPSAGSTRTVRQAPADRPPAAADCPKPLPAGPRGSQNGLSETKTDRKRSRARTRRTREEHCARGPSARPSRTVRQTQIELKTARPRKSTLPIHHWISQTVEAVETRVWGHEKRQPKMLYPKKFAF